MECRERVARAIAKARTGFDPDMLVFSEVLAVTRDGYKIVPPDCFVALWKTYLDAADAAIAEVHQFEDGN